ncbi:MAG: hypothetical protein M3R70_05525 [Actinomycetota bacterium]|nr:hypothetical protein [Actinomycetota bacterium]
MTFGLKVLLLLVAAVLFFIAAVMADIHQGDLIGWGLCLTALALIVEDLPLGQMRWGAGGPRQGSPPPR